MRCSPRATRHGAGLHVFVAGDAHFQCRHGITPLSRNTASTVCPEIAEQRRRVPVLVRLDRPQPVAMVLRLAALLPRHRMGVVEADQPLAAGAVQRQRVIKPVRLLRRHRRPRHHEADPMAALRVHDEHLAVEVEQHIKGGVARLRHGMELSD